MWPFNRSNTNNNDGSSGSCDMSIDLGSETTVMYIKGRNNEYWSSSILALPTGKKVPPPIGVHVRNGYIDEYHYAHPIKNGYIDDVQIVEKFIKMLIKQIYIDNIIDKKLAHIEFLVKIWRFCKLRVKSRVVMAIPHGATEDQQQDMINCAKGAGVHRVFLVDQLVASALGTGLPLKKDKAIMIVEIGSSITQIGVIMNSSVAIGETMAFGGESMNDDIISLMRDKYHVLMGSIQAEKIKRGICSCAPLTGPENCFLVKGLNTETGMPEKLEITSEDMIAMVKNNLQPLIHEIKSMLDRVSPELRSEIEEEGMVISGGGSLLMGLQDHLQAITGIKCRRAEAPKNSVSRGAMIFGRNIHL